MPLTTGLLKLGNQDGRRIIREHNFPDGAITDFTILDSSRPLGNHYHRDKGETFYFLEGMGTIRVAPVSLEGEIIGEVEEITIQPGLVVVIPAYHAHRFDMSDGARFICFSSRPFDPGDLVPCPIK